MIKKYFLFALFLPLLISAQSFDGGFNFNLPWNDSTSQKFLPKFPIVSIQQNNFVSVDIDGNFSSGGKKIKFWGTNAVGDGAFPQKNNAPQIAGRMRKVGINLVRFHHIDNPWSSYSLVPGSYSSSRDLDKNNLDLMENFIAQLKANGIYINMNLNVSRKFHPMDGIPDADSLNNYSTDYLKGLTLFDPYLITLEKEYAQQLLTHVNPYTGKKLADDPVMAMLETNNENSLYRLWHDNQLKLISQGGKLIYRHAHMLDSLFNKFIADKYLTTSALQNAWNAGTVAFGLNEQIKNPGFEDANISAYWEVEQNNGARATIEKDLVNPYRGTASAKVIVTQTAGTDWYVQFKQKILTIKKDSSYTVSFAARSDQPREISVSAMNDLSPWNWYGGKNISLTSAWQIFSFSFKAPENNTGHTRVSFSLGKTTGSFWFDEVSFTTSGVKGLETSESIESRNIKRIDFTDCISYSDQRVKDISEFYIKLEQDYFSSMFDYLHNTLGVKVPIVGTNWSIGAADNSANSVSDYIDNHSYWDHPSFPKIPWSGTDWLINNQPMTKDSYGGTIPDLFAGVPMSGKPFTISEYNHAYPNRYQTEGLLFLLGYSSFHGADGIMMFDYSGDRNYWAADTVRGYFDTHRNPLFMSLYPSCSLAFRNEMIAKSKNVIKINYTPETLYLLAKSGGNDWRGVVGYDRHLALTNGVRTESYKSTTQTNFNSLPATPVPPYKTDTDQIVYDNSAGTITVAAEKFAAAAGYLSNLKNKSIGNLSVADSKAGDFGVITWISLTEEKLSSSSSSLITLASKVQNTNMIWDGTRTVHDKWGSAPTQIYPLSVKLDLKIYADSIRIYPLDSRGKENLPVSFIVKPVSVNHFIVGLDQSLLKSVWFGIEKYGLGDPTSVKDEAALPSEFKLEQNYPNPFNPSTMINYHLPVSGTVSLKIYDILGRELATLINEFKPAGIYTVNFSPSSLSSGIYFYSLRCGNFNATKKMILIR